jgi:hypothetical protein
MRYITWSVWFVVLLAAVAGVAYLHQQREAQLLHDETSQASSRAGVGVGLAPKDRDRQLALKIAAQMGNHPIEYNKPSKLQLGESTQVELVIKTNERQDVTAYFKGLQGDLERATALVSRDVAAELSGPPDRLDVKLRGDEKMRTTLSPVPITWVWDVRPLKPGEAHVTLEVFSYVGPGKDKEPVVIRVFEDTWYVNAQGYEWVKYWAAELDPIQKFLAGIGAAVVGGLAWFGIKGLGKKKQSDFET